jgi:hypothetical protein
MRLVFAVTGLVALVPTAALEHGKFADLIAVAVGIALLAYEFMQRSGGRKAALADR